MEKITAFKCSHCHKILETYSGMYKHEKMCFYNPCTNSCITCGNLLNVGCIGNQKLTDHEEQVLGQEVPGTFTMEWNGDPEDCTEYPVFNQKYKYLEEAEPKNYCKVKRTVLNKLTTGCSLWASKPD